MSNSGICRVHYFHQGHSLGTQTFYACGYSESGISYSGHWPHVALFCPQCGSLWARAEHEPNFDYRPSLQKPWMVQEKLCRGCGDGDLLLYDDLKEIDLPLLRYELEVLLNKES
jgi:hypothetical protein